MSDAPIRSGEHPAGDCLLFSTADWQSRYMTNKQHTARELVRRGWRVLYVETVGIRTPRVNSQRDWVRLLRRLGTGLRCLLAGPTEVEPGLFVHSPLVIPVLRRLAPVRRLNGMLLRWPLRRFVGRQGFVQPLIWTYHPFMLEAVEGLARGPLVYHCVDDVAAVPGVDAVRFNAAEAELLERCDAAFTTSPALQEKCERLSPKAHFFGNVVDFGHFSRAHAARRVPASLSGIAAPRIAYHGVLSEFKVDFALIASVAERRPDWQFVLIGETREGQDASHTQSLRALPNVHFLGHRPYAELPDYLGQMAVGMLPTLLNQYTKSMFPMKFYEYLAAGVPVVSTALDFTRNPLPHLCVAHDADSFVAAIESQLRRGRLSAAEAEVAVADNTWGSRMERMLAIAYATLG